MTGRERILGAMKGGQPDRVPISSYELNGCNPDAWENGDPSYREVMDLVREKADCIYMWGVGLPNRAVEGRVRRDERRDGLDTYITVTVDTPLGPLISRHRRTEGLHTVWTLEHVLKTDEDIDRWLSIPFEYVPPDLSGFREVERRVEDRGIVQGDTADPICVVSELFHFADFLVLAQENPSRVRQLLDLVHERLLHHLGYVLENLSVPAFRICGPEYASAPYLRPEQFREFVTNYDREIIALMHRHGTLARLHCHGRICDILDQFVEMGADATDPVEAPPDGDITLAEVKEWYGDRLCLIGNVQTRVLEHGTEQQVAETVRRCMDDAKEGGGYILCPTAMPILSPLPEKVARNLIAYIETAYDCAPY
jgi:hypothetical protein